MVRSVLGLLGLLFLSGCGETAAPGGKATILLLGDSMLASNSAAGAAVADVIEGELGREVIDRSVPGARYFYGLPITGAAGLRLTAQPRPGPWEVVVVNGGGNDFLFGCACGRCNGVMNRLISADGRTGAIPDFVARLQADGAYVVYAGYLRNPGTATPIKGCRDEGDELDRRLAALDRINDRMTFLPMSDVVPYGDTSYQQADRIHPSVKGSRAIGLRIARHIATLPPR